jgi:hypothetical protein
LRDGQSSMRPLLPAFRHSRLLLSNPLAPTPPFYDSTHDALRINLHIRQSYSPQRAEDEFCELHLSSRFFNVHSWVSNCRWTARFIWGSMSL